MAIIIHLTKTRVGDNKTATFNKKTTITAITNTRKPAQEATAAPPQANTISTQVTVTTIIVAILLLHKTTIILRIKPNTTTKDNCSI